MMVVPDNLVCMNVALAAGVRVDVWVDPDTATRIWNMAEHECQPEGDAQYFECPACGAHWVKIKRMINRQMNQTWNRMPEHLVQRMREQRRNVRPA